MDRSSGTASRPATDVVAKICHLAGQAVAEYRMTRPGDRILVGLSGGKDSMVLMHVLDRLCRNAPFVVHVRSVFVDMGFPDQNAAALEEYCGRQGWTHETVRLPGAELIERKNATDRPCGLCSRLRRGQLHRAANRLGCNKLALGHNLDDICVSFLMSLFRGGGLTTMGPHVTADAGSKAVIRPLCFVTRQLIENAADRLELPAAGKCPYEERLDRKGDRAYLERLLKRIDVKFPHVRDAMRTSLRDVRPAYLLDPKFLVLETTPPCGRSKSAPALRPGASAGGRK
jgi:tRNA 2-thiocytidine biosynthesis protein TtcA